MKSTLRRALFPATRTLAGVVASFATMWFVCRAAHAGPGPSILAAVLAIGFGRRAKTSSAVAFALAIVRIGGIALAVAAIASLLHAKPLLGAVVYTVFMSLSVWLRDFGPRARTIGGLIALPLVALLVIPAAPPHAAGGPLVDIALVIGAGVVALSYATLLAAIGRALERRSGRGSHPNGALDAPDVERARRPGLSPTARMALQMGAALALAFAVGFLVFPAHWGWVVLTAFIVCSGARGRGDALYKALLRLGGALAGTVVAAMLAHAWAPSGPFEAATIFTLLFFGLWLRDVNYAYWAFATTSILALLARSRAAIDVALLGSRLEAILVGACCGVVATWFVFPIRTKAVVRRRLADALLALDECVTHAHRDDTERATKRALFDYRIAKLEEVAPPLRLHRRVLARGREDHPAGWIELAASLRDRSHLFESPDPDDAARIRRIRRAIGATRRAIAGHAKPGERALTVESALCLLHGEAAGERTAPREPSD